MRLAETIQVAAAMDAVRQAVTEPPRAEAVAR